MASTSVMWFRRDLRLHDNPALLAACAADEVVPLFVLDPHLWQRAGKVRRAYLAASLRALDESLGGHLVVRRGDPREAVPAVAREVEALTVHLAADYGPYGSRRDQEVTEALLEHQVETQPLGSPYAVAPGRVRNGSGDPYKVYSAFARAWADHGWRDPVDAPKRQAWAALRSDKVPDETLPQGTAVATAGEKAALRAWKKFLDGPVDDYDEGRDIPGGDGVSRMSTYLRWGEIHPRTMLADLARKRSTSSATYRKELAWREFYADVLWHRPDSARQDYRESFSAMSYDEPGDAFEAWKKGETGFPIVDAGMRELLATGFMHNRVRMITASFLVKDLHVWWRHGARHFMEWLADGDLASNQLNWQWVAGSGTDAAPYFRIFNPTSQGQKFDPDGTYIRRWVPELEDVPAKEIHEPQDVDGYPAPIVDHKEERAESLRRFGSVKSAGRG
jgi:deoxyribodipyrimidine photo-lyase